MDNMVEFAKRMKAQREKLGLTQAQLGEKIGVSAQTISAYEKNISSGKGKTPTLDKVISIAHVLGVSLDYLCGTAPAEQGCKMESLRDIVECLFKISRYVPCYGGVKQRNLNDDEQEMQAGYPDELKSSSIPTAVFTLDNDLLAKFLDTKNKLYGLYRDGTLTEDLYNTIIDGQLAGLQQYEIHEKITSFGDLKEADLKE